MREARVYSEIVPFDITAEEVARRAPAAIILSGGPASVYAEGAPHMDPAILDLGIPVLGFCYGIQEMALHLGGAIPKTDIGEYGFAELTVLEPTCELLEGVPVTSQVWMSHRDSVGTAPPGFSVTGSDRHDRDRRDGGPVAQALCDAVPLPRSPTRSSGG